MPRLALVIVDVDPGAHGLALLEAISGCADRPQIVVITALEETYMTPIARKHGASACLGKPITLQRLGLCPQARFEAVANLRPLGIFGPIDG